MADTVSKHVPFAFFKLACTNFGQTVMSIVPSKLPKVGSIKTK
jgi:hypothetical protein